MTDVANKDTHGQIGYRAGDNIGIFIELRIMTSMATTADSRIGADHREDEVVIAVLVPARRTMAAFAAHIGQR